jgi:lauroyl/myristoyl acyltransferase
MILYFLFRLGYFLSNALSVKAGYRMANFLADLHYSVSSSDRKAVLKNLRVILGDSCPEDELKTKAREVFRNFAKYLVDFFRFSKIDKEYIKKYVKIYGFEHFNEGLSRKKGVILLSAHIGNWELGGFVFASLGYPMQAVVLTHKNKKINDFFTKQRSISSMKPVEIGLSLRSCFNILKNNGLLAVLGDRDFSKKGVYVNFFGKTTLIPKGAAVFSRRTGAAIVPSFMLRQSDDTFILKIEPPIFTDIDTDEDTAIKNTAEKYSAVIESYIRKYPTQWYMFREAWNGN